jgi:hypothetical protein
MFSAWDTRDRTPKAISAVTLCRSIKMPLAWPAGVQAECSQASLVDPERHAEHAAHVQSRCFRAEPRPTFVPAGVLDPEDGLVPGGIDAGAVPEFLLEAVQQQWRLAGGEARGMNSPPEKMVWSSAFFTCSAGQDFE